MTWCFSILPLRNSYTARYRSPYNDDIGRQPGKVPKSMLSSGNVQRWLGTIPGVRPVVRTCVLTANTPLARTRLRRALSRVDRPIWLEIGGHRRRAGWIVTNVNAVARLYLDATRRWPLDDDAVEYVFSDNVIEHLPLEAARAMLVEAHRCLRPGGTIRIVTPDVRAHVEMYLSGAGAMRNGASSHYRDLGLDVEHPIDLVRIPIAAFGHHAGYVYDFDTLAAELERAGFSNPTRFECGSSDKAALNGLDIRSAEGGAQLAVQATA